MDVDTKNWIAAAADHVQGTVEDVLQAAGVYATIAVAASIADLAAATREQTAAIVAAGGLEQENNVLLGELAGKIDRLARQEQRGVGRAAKLPFPSDQPVPITTCGEAATIIVQDHGGSYPNTVRCDLPADRPHDKHAGRDSRGGWHTWTIPPNPDQESTVA